MCSALGASATLAGAATAGASAAAHAKATVTLHFWNAYNETDKEASTMEHVIIPKFEKENPGIKVVDTTLPYSGLLDEVHRGRCCRQSSRSASVRTSPGCRSLPLRAWRSSSRRQAWFNALKKTALPGPLSTNEFRGLLLRHS